MYKITTHPILIRFTLWTVAALLLASFYMVWNGGFAQLLEYLNDIFMIRFESL